MPTNYEKSIEAIKAKHGGVLPSDLYLRTNAELSKLVFDLTGKQPSGTASKTSLVTRIEKHEAKIAAAGAKRKADDDAVSPAKKAKPETLPVSPVLFSPGTPGALGL